MGTWAAAVKRPAAPTAATPTVGRRVGVGDVGGRLRRRCKSDTEEEHKQISRRSYSLLALSSIIYTNKEEERGGGEEGRRRSDERVGEEEWKVGGEGKVSTAQDGVGGRRRV